MPSHARTSSRRFARASSAQTVTTLPRVHVLTRTASPYVFASSKNSKVELRVGLLKLSETTRRPQPGGRTTGSLNVYETGVLIALASCSNSPPGSSAPTAAFDPVCISAVDTEPPPFFELAVVPSVSAELRGTT